MSSIIIDIDSVSKSYGKLSLFSSLSLQIEKGELFGIIGADGAGKSTLFELMVTLLSADAGRITINGMDSVNQRSSIRSSVGYMPGRFSLYNDLGVKENLDFYATLYGTSLDQGYEVISPIWDQISSFWDRPAGKLSGGMKQKLALCCALVHRPSILFLDEPTTGVDPVSRKEFWDILKLLNSRGMTIVVSTPYMDEALNCNRVAFMQQGRLLGVNLPRSFIEQYPYDIYSIYSNDSHTLMRYLRAEQGTISCFAFGHSIHWSVASGDRNTVERVASSDTLNGAKMRVVEPTLEDVFIYLMQREQ
ncbi:MAG: ABC transporter ATP-binding protein [Bacteroidales bacterium]